MLKLVENITRNVFFDGFSRKVSIMDKLFQEVQGVHYIRAQVSSLVSVQNSTVRITQNT